MNLDVAVCLPQEATTIARIRAMVSTALDSLGVTPGCIDDIRLAVSEACSNVIDHAADGDEYEVRVQVDDRRCSITVRDAGDGFDADALDGVMPSANSPRGRGVAIMRAVMDHVQFSSEPETGTIVHLVKTLTLRDDAP